MQTTAILANHLDYKKRPLPAGPASGFADSDSISAWAKDSVDAMQKAGILGGKSGNLFDPQDLATRAEVAAVFTRFVEAAAQ